MTDFRDFIADDELNALIQCAHREDLGPDGRDVTSAMFIPEDRRCDAAMVSRQPGILAGTCLLERIAAVYDQDIAVSPARKDGEAIDAGVSLARFRGPLRGVLSMERVALNFVTHLSGIATLTAKYVEKVDGTKARIYDTRKTLPGLRGLEKYAVACGGGMNHRLGLYDAMLIKDNHLSLHTLRDVAAAVSYAASRARSEHPDLKFIEVEVDTLEQLELVLGAAVDVILLDNMSNDQLREAVAIRVRLAPGVELEASGGVTLESVRAIAETGVDRISVGALTHSAPALDIGLDIT